MVHPDANRVSALPAIEKLLQRDEVGPLLDQHGRAACTQALRDVVSAARESLLAGEDIDIAEAALTAHARFIIEAAAQPHLRPVFNLTGTVLHTNLGRALLPIEAVTAMIEAATQPSNLEYDLDSLKRGDRDNHIEADLCILTGAEAATVVNNNAAAVLLVLNSLALRKEVPISRGELIEIGGSFRIPDVMARAGVKLREIGTTNRTHLADFVAAINDKTGVVMRVHPSNFAIEGFTATAGEAEVAAVCRARNVPFIVDLGSGALVDLRRFGLPHEPTPAETLAAGADLVTFSGDKLLGGPQAGIIVGRADLVSRIKRNPMKRALRCDKVTLAALSAVLRLYHDPDRLVQRLPTFRALTRPRDVLDDLAKRVVPALRAALVDVARVEVIDCASQIGSGALPTNTVASRGLAIRPLKEKRGAGAALKRIVKALSQLPTPVLGAVSNGALILDVRCLEDEDTFTAQLASLATKSL